MEITEREIVFKFERNGKEREQIQILADLNSVSTTTILDILRKHGSIPERSAPLARPKSELDENMKSKIIELYNRGYNCPKIYRELRLSRYQVFTFMKEEGLIQERSKRKAPAKSTEATRDDSKNVSLLEKIDAKIARLEVELRELQHDRRKIVEIMKKVN